MTLQEMKELLELVELSKASFTGKTEDGLPGAQVWTIVREDLIRRIAEQENKAHGTANL